MNNNKQINCNLKGKKNEIRLESMKFQCPTQDTTLINALWQWRLRKSVRQVHETGGCPIYHFSFQMLLLSLHWGELHSWLLPLWPDIWAMVDCWKCIPPPIAQHSRSARDIPSTYVTFLVFLKWIAYSCSDMSTGAAGCHLILLRQQGSKLDSLF